MTVRNEAINYINPIFWPLLFHKECQVAYLLTADGPAVSTLADKYPTNSTGT